MSDLVYVAAKFIEFTGNGIVVEVAGQRQVFAPSAVIMPPTHENKEATRFLQTLRGLDPPNFGENVAAVLIVKGSEDPTAIRLAAKAILRNLERLEDALDDARSKIDFTEKEKEALGYIAQRQDTSENTALRRALRVYQLIVTGTHRLEEVNPMPKMAPTPSTHSREVAVKFQDRVLEQQKSRPGWLADTAFVDELASIIDSAVKQTQDKLAHKLAKGEIGIL